MVEEIVIYIMNKCKYFHNPTENDSYLDIHFQLPADEKR